MVEKADREDRSHNTCQPVPGLAYCTHAMFISRALGGTATTPQGQVNRTIDFLGHSILSLERTWTSTFNIPGNSKLFRLQEFGQVQFADGKQQGSEQEATEGPPTCPLSNSRGLHTGLSVSFLTLPSEMRTGKSPASQKVVSALRVR